MYDPINEPDGMQVVGITPENARVLLSRYAYDNNRSVSEAAVRRWLRLMQTDRWKISSLDFFRNAENGQVVLLNGHRRLTAVMRCEKTVSFRAIMGTLPSAEDIHEQYLTYDDPNSTRRFHEVLSGTRLAELGTQWPPRVRSAVGLVEDGFDCLPYAKRAMPTGVFAEQIEIICPWLEQVRVYRGLLPIQGSSLWRGLVAAPTMGLALVTLRYDRCEAETFWGRVAGDDGLEKGTAEWLANRYARESGWNKGISPALRSRYLSACWNAAKSGRAIAKAYPDASKPIQIRGTPFK